MDGTVTDMLELYLQEQIEVKKLKTRLQPAADLTLEFNTQTDETIMARKILLQGQHSQKNYLYSESYIMVDRLPTGFKQLLIQSCLPIGKLWNQFRLETYKQVLNTEQTPAADTAQYFQMQPQDPLLSRRYWVYSQQQIIMQITEQFPAHYYMD